MIQTFPPASATKDSASDDGAPTTGTPVIMDTTKQTFDEDVIKASQQTPVVVDFWAPWCQPCLQLAPILQRVIKSFGDKIRLVKLNIDEYPLIPAQLGVKSIPTLVAFAGGKPIDVLTGAMTEAKLIDFIKALVKDGGDDELTGLILIGLEALKSRDFVQASEVFAKVLVSDSNNVRAIGGLARAYLGIGDVDRAQQVIDFVSKDQHQSSEIADVIVEIRLLHQFNALADDVAGLKQQLTDQPANHEVGYNLAVALNRQGGRDQAADVLLIILAKDRQWNEGAAHRLLLDFFTAWGIDDPATLRARRRLSTVIFS